MAHQKYSKYKNSGIEWLGEIPEHWKKGKLGKIANFRRGSFPQPYGLKKWYNDENGFPFIQVYDVGENMKLKPTTKRKISDEAKKKSVFIKKGTLILTIQGSIGRLAITDYDACIDRTLLIFQSYNLPIKVGYFKQVISLLFSFEEKKAIGSTIKTINKEKLSSFIIPIPNFSEQTAIANYLDQKLEKINAFITKKKQLITLLEEQKAAIINDAVTKGLDKTVAMKDSGVEWLGEIPEHWEVMRLKNIAKISNGKDCNKLKGKYPVYGSGGIFGWTENYIYDKPSVLLGRKGTIDKPIYVTEPFWTVDTAFYTKIYEDKIISLFFYFLCCNINFGYYSSKTALPSMTQTSLYEAKFSIPPKTEQQKIVTYIETATKKIDRTISTIQKELDLVSEYKTALIAEAVTGKIRIS